MEINQIILSGVQCTGNQACCSSHQRINDDKFSMHFQQKQFQKINVKRNNSKSAGFSCLQTPMCSSFTLPLFQLSRCGIKVLTTLSFFLIMGPESKHTQTPILKIKIVVAWDLWAFYRCLKRCPLLLLKFSGDNGKHLSD